MTLCWGGLDKFIGKKIFSVDEIKNLEFDKIFIANAHYNTLEEVLNLGIPEEKIIIANQKVFDEHESKCPARKIKFAMPSVLTPKIYTRKIFDEKPFSIDGNCFFKSGDYVRIGTLQLLAEEINTRNVSGDIAELGVFQGDFSKYLNELFPDRTLHLFDTFEGFDQKDIQIDTKKIFTNQQTINGMEFLKNTSIDLVMSKMKNPDKIEIHQGYFPDTIPTEEKIFAFVSLDPDLYKPTLEGLRYFYPRLSKHGYIMIHDYNNVQFFKSVHQAIEDFRQEFDINIVPIPDENGTLVISK